jgi:hypothetical protein
MLRPLKLANFPIRVSQQDECSSLFKRVQRRRIRNWLKRVNRRIELPLLHKKISLLKLLLRRPLPPDCRSEDYRDAKKKTYTPHDRILHGAEIHPAKSGRAPAIACRLTLSFCA